MFCGSKNKKQQHTRTQTNKKPPKQNKTNKQKKPKPMQVRVLPES